MAFSPTRPAPLDIDALRPRFTGRVLAPGDDGYDAARVVLLGGVDSHPAVIVKVADTDDVREVIALARETGHELASHQCTPIAVMARSMTLMPMKGAIRPPSP